MFSLPNVPGVDNEPRREGAGGVDAFSSVWAFPGLLFPIASGVVELGEAEDEGDLPELLCSPPVSHLPKAC